MEEMFPKFIEKMTLKTFAKCEKAISRRNLVMYQQFCKI